MDQNSNNKSEETSFGASVQSLAAAVQENEAADRAVAANRFSQAREYAAHKVAQLRKVAIEKADIVRSRAAEGWTDTCGKAKDIHKAGEEYVRANPTQSVLYALGAGILLGLLLRRR